MLDRVTHLAREIRNESLGGNQLAVQFGNAGLQDGLVERGGAQTGDLLVLRVGDHLAERLA